MEEAVVLQTRAAVLAAELERLRGIGMPLELAAALLARCLEARPQLWEREASCPLPPRHGPRHERAAWAGAGCADEG